ncbi:hypothetical protein HMPREF0860_1005 [Treponema socranskii subsp. socranskii VPI DR56BR1116 = ATCC 35536]|uniref:Uncharacterized protein n=1 Tax=Treponema socranskii subsp. socranskii VPI DR56BR1116 = ATCC 35536 TaxID=1125725 RepID=U2MFE4_TRESO|nr:hypothetical protein HMPREF1325_0232 [Treponema socranskii subsp. socranskii VPI DR56BR1116 = ATCC 35536]ERK00385.1 hypothetical protein HMPREF0860_1005 [Treponema socranskii subsp. socranskii VPI DR56BR1116 = ATCC 35536]
MSGAVTVYTCIRSFAIDTLIGHKIDFYIKVRTSSFKSMSLTKGESLPLARTLLRAAPSGGDTPQRPGWRCVSLAVFTLT